MGEMLAPSPKGEDESVKAIEVKIAMRFAMPSADEVKTYQLTDQPYRNWCRHCVMGKADDIRHVAVSENCWYTFFAFGASEIYTTEEKATWHFHTVLNLFANAYLVAFQLFL